jgi:D-beta-D-heptose 7-phosphate kinase/D-beta-D-heptose 1-phosphate adenosyltransferase
MNILVIGDIMVDVNYISKINRIAPEASIPIYEVSNIHYILGGASNVAQNLKKLNTNVELIGVIGKDEMGEKIKHLLNEKEIKHTLYVDNNRKTTQKNRIFKNKELHVRFDIEETDNISEEIEKTLFQFVTQKKEVEAIIISDYDKGVITPDLCNKIINYANEHNIYTFIDPKIKNVQKYKNCFCFKPNLHEGQLIARTNQIGDIFNNIKSMINPQHIVLTCGEKGMYIDNIENSIHPESNPHVTDVTGAGDVVMSVLVYMFLLKKDLLYASKVANYVAGKSIQYIGNYDVSLIDIHEYYSKQNPSNLIDSTISNNPRDKIIHDFEREKIMELSKKSRVVFTNGCFDIIHSAHIENLQFAKKQGDLLVVGLNSDESVRRLKGSPRPINHIHERSRLLSLFDFVDYIIVFEQDTPLDIIRLLQPYIIVKGSDYKKEEIIGLEYSKNVVLFEYKEGKSSTNVINKILQKP